MVSKSIQEAPADQAPRASRLIRWALASILIGLGTVLGMRFLRGYPWLLAIFSGLAIGALSFTTLLTLTRLREQLEERRWQPPQQ